MITGPMPTLRLLLTTLHILTLTTLHILTLNVVNASEGQGKQQSNVQALNFRVLLDDREIGFHRFRIEQTADAQTVDVDANFKVTFFAIPVYRYSHSNREVWRNGCLASIRSSTDDNGDRFSVDGARNVSGFSINTGEARYELDNACIMTFAYWDKNFLEQKQLLNAQDGKWLPIDIDFIGVEDINLGTDFDNKRVAAKKYRLRNSDKKIDITVWYDNVTDRWLSLESRVSGDRLIRYLPIPSGAKTDA